MAEETTQQFYYASGEKIPLVRSRHFLAVEAEDPASPEASSEASARIASAVTGFAGPGRILDLPEYNLTVISLPENGGLESPAAGADTPPIESIRAAVSAQPGVVEGPPVYETAEEPGQEGLVPIGEVLVRFKPDVDADARRRLLSKHGLTVKQADHPEPGTDLLQVTDDRDAVAVANALHESELVEFAEPNFLVLSPRLSTREQDGDVMTTMPDEASAIDADEVPASEAWSEVVPEATVATTAALAPAERTAPPSDPGFPSQWGLVKIKAPEAWDISMGNPAISVAIIDEGNDLSHEDMVYKTPGYDAYDGDDNPSPQPQDGHGTSCGGIAAARANNGKGGAGVAPNSKVLPVRIAKGVGGGFWDTTSAKVADGIRKAVDRGADVLSNSYSVAPSTVVTNAFIYAQTNGRGGRGCPIAAATGNADIRGVIYPARLSPTIRGFLAVGASNEWDQRKSKTSLDGETWWGSNYGPEVDVVAPGVHIYTTDITGAAGYGGGNYVTNFNGTSSATPHVAGLMALILSVDPDLRSWEVEDIVKLTADDLGAGGRDEHFGFGRINARRALEAASRMWYAITITPVFLGKGKETFMRANVRMYNPGINTVRLDALTLTSHNPNWTAEIDRFEYRPNPGNVLAPRSGQDVRLNRILLRANGNQSAWSYRWALSWSYTYWRPAAAVFPLAPTGDMPEGEGRTATAQGVRGGAEGPKPTGTGPAARAGDRLLAADGADGQQHGDVAGDLLTIDRAARRLTIQLEL
jgi:thermitase